MNLKPALDQDAKFIFEPQKIMCLNKFIYIWTHSLSYIKKKVVI